VLTTTIRTYESATVVAPTGDIDREVSAEFRAVMQQAASRDRPLLVVDMAQVSYLDSAGLAVLVSTHRSLQVEQRLGLANVPRRMQRVLHDTAMGSLMQIHAAGEPWPWPDVPQSSSAAS
jgi:anti-anti-sigma factor